MLKAKDLYQLSERDPQSQSIVGPMNQVHQIVYILASKWTKQVHYEAELDPFVLYLERNKVRVVFESGHTREVERITEDQIKSM